MKKIGRGWQYSVYDIGNGGVLKKPNTRMQTFWQIVFYRFPKNIFRAYFEYERMTNMAQNSIIFLKPLLEKLGSKLGNPRIHNDYSYEQDKVVPVNKYFEKHALEENKKIVDQYVELIFLFWQNGFGDQPFKLTRNYGVTNEGVLVLIDLGELYFTQEKALKRISSKHWHLTYFQDGKLKEYYLQKMNENFTIENLKKYWK